MKTLQNQSEIDSIVVYCDKILAKFELVIAQRDELLAACKAALQCQLDGLDENTVDALESAVAKCELESAVAKCE